MSWKIRRRDMEWYLQSMAQPVVPTGGLHKMGRSLLVVYDYQQPITVQGWAPGTLALPAELVWPLTDSGGKPAATFGDVPNDVLIRLQGMAPNPRPPPQKKTVSVKIRRSRNKKV